MSLTSYRAAPPRGKIERDPNGRPEGNVMKGHADYTVFIRFVDLAATYSPAP